MRDQELREQAGVRVAYDGDGEPWDELTNAVGVRTGWFRYRNWPDGDGEELLLSQLADGYGLDRVVAASEDNERDLLLWLHADAAWKAAEFEKRLIEAQLDVLDRGKEIDRLRVELALAVRLVKICTGHPDTGKPSHFDLIRRAEASRRDWAAEAVGVREKLERLENLALNPGALHAGVLVGVGGEHDWVPSDEQCQRAAGLIERAIRRGMEPGYVTQAELRLLAAIEAPENVCACVTDEQAKVIRAGGFSRPVCAVHPECTCFPGQPRGYAPEPPSWNPDCPSHGDPRHLEPPSVHPGEKP